MPALVDKFACFDFLSNFKLERFLILRVVLNVSCLGILSTSSLHLASWSIFLTKPIVSGVLRSISITVVLWAAVVTKPVIVGNVFSIYVIFLFQPIFLTSPLVLVISL